VTVGVLRPSRFSLFYRPRSKRGAHMRYVAHSTTSLARLGLGHSLSVATPLIAITETAALYIATPSEVTHSPHSLLVLLPEYSSSPLSDSCSSSALLAS
jgi:hypothetical protein